MVDQIIMFKETYQNCKCSDLILYLYLCSGVHAKDINKLAD